MHALRNLAPLGPGDRVLADSLAGLFALESKFLVGAGDSNPRALPFELPTSSCQTYTGFGNHSQSLDTARRQGLDLWHALAPFFRGLGPNWVQSLSSRQGTGWGAKSPFLSVRQVAEILGVSTATVYRLCEHGRLPHIRIRCAIRIFWP